MAQKRQIPWDTRDVLFLRDALAHGMSCAEIARFLRKTAREVEEEAKARRSYGIGRLRSLPRRKKDG
jgi:hypothetical protein